jgi:hypothetical protein
LQKNVEKCDWGRVTASSADLETNEMMSKIMGVVMFVDGRELEQMGERSGDGGGWCERKVEGELWSKCLIKLY